MKPNIFFILCLIFLVFVQFQKVESQTGNNYLDSTRTSARVIFFTNGGDFDTVPPELCAPDENGDCREENYGESIILIGFLPIFIGFVICCFCPCFWMCRICCWGGYRPTEGWMYPGNPRTYSAKEINILRILGIFAGISTIILFIIAIIGNGIISTSQNNASNSLADTYLSVVSDLQTINETYVTFDVDNRLDLQVESQINDALIEAQSYVDDVNDARDKEEQVSDVREAITVIALVLALFPPVVLCAGAVFKNHWCAWCPAICMWFTLFLLWISFGLTYPFSALVGDLCIGVNDAIYHNETTQATDILLECQNSATLDGLLQTNQDLINRVLSDGCNGLDFACNGNLTDIDPSFNVSVQQLGFNPPLAMCSPDFNLSTCLEAPVNLQRFVNETSVLDTILGCPTQVSPTLEFNNSCPYDEVINGPCMFNGTEQEEIPCEVNATLATLTYTPVRDCVTMCRELFARNASDLLVYSADGVIVFHDLHVNLLTPLVNCVPITEYWNKNRPVVCGNLGDGLAALIVGLGGQAILGIAILVVSIMATKRYNDAYSDTIEFE